MTKLFYFIFFLPSQSRKVKNQKKKYDKKVECVCVCEKFLSNTNTQSQENIIHRDAADLD